MADNLKYLRCLCECPFKKSSPEEEELAYRSKKIDQMIKQDQRKMQQEVKLLLLGMNYELFRIFFWKPEISNIFCNDVKLRLEINLFSLYLYLLLAKFFI